MERDNPKYAEMAADFASIILASKDLREDLHIFFMLHEDEEADTADPTKKRRIISVTSRAVREKLNPERLFTYTFFTSMSEYENGEVSYNFITGRDITCAAKTPMGCFKEKLIPNDMQLIVDTIARYENDDEE